MRPPEQITEEIEKLKALKPKVRQYSSFGDDHHAAIDAQLDVLEKRMSEEDIWNEWQDPENPEEMPNTLDEALQARQWLDGGMLDGPPSKNWKELAQ